MGDRNTPGQRAGGHVPQGYCLTMLLRYPDGVTGVALLLMRLSCALIAFPALTRLWPASVSWWPPAILSTLLSLALVVGLGTRIAALLLVAVLAADLLAASGELVLVMLASASGAGALTLLGPGAYSIDAQLFGRRVIRLEPRSPERGGVG